LRADRQFPEIERLGVEEARARVAAGRARFVDVRSREAFAAGHLPGALSAPARAVIARALALPRGPDLILYCT
jgi:rhodanese-related sulfurtransferase